MQITNQTALEHDSEEFGVVESGKLHWSFKQNSEAIWKSGELRLQLGALRRLWGSPVEAFLLSSSHEPLRVALLWGSVPSLTNSEEAQCSCALLLRWTGLPHLDQSCVLSSFQENWMSWSGLGPSLIFDFPIPSRSCSESPLGTRYYAGLWR